MKAWKMPKHLPKVVILKTVLKSLTNFTGKNLWWSPFLIKLQAATLLKKNCMTLLQLLTLFRMGLLGAAHGWGRGGGGGSKSPALISVTHILQWWNLAVLPWLKKIQKICESRDTPLELCWHQPSACFHRKSRNTNTDSILVHNF